MISKNYRLKEREVKKVLRKAKPFFSFGVVLNSLPNNMGYNRFALVIGAKSVNSNVTRNYFRRKFYDLTSSHIHKATGFDCIFVVKKKTKLDKNSPEACESFKKDIQFLLRKI